MALIVKCQGKMPLNCNHF